MSERDLRVRRKVLHKQIYRPGPFGGTVNTTLCGRMQTTGDGMNVGEVTCKFCLRIIQRKEDAATDRKGVDMNEVETIRTALNTVSCRCMRDDGITWECGRCSALSALAALQEERERLRADSRRLDWLASECNMEQLEHVWIHSDPTPEAFRAAIDAAIGEPAASQDKE